MTIEILKFLVQPVVLERSPSGKILGEKVGQAVPLYTADDVSEFIANVESQVAAENPPKPPKKTIPKSAKKGGRKK